MLGFVNASNRRLNQDSGPLYDELQFRLARPAALIDGVAGEFHFSMHFHRFEAYSHVEVSHMIRESVSSLSRPSCQDLRLRPTRQVMKSFSSLIDYTKFSNDIII